MISGFKLLGAFHPKFELVSWNTITISALLTSSSRVRQLISSRVCMQVADVSGARGKASS